MKQNYVKRRKRRDHDRIYRLLILPCIVLFFVSAFLLARYSFNSVKTAHTNSHLAAISGSREEFTAVDPAAAEPLPDPFAPSVSSNTSLPVQLPQPSAHPNSVSFEPGTFQYIGNAPAPATSQLRAINPDVVAWLNIPNVIDLPVVYRDNDFYLSHDFYGLKNPSGTLFLDENHPFRADTQYLLIHGHAMHDGSMFGMITHYRRSEFIKAHPYLTLRTLYARDTYEIIASCLLSPDDMLTVARMLTCTFDTQEDFNSFINNVFSHALHCTDQPIPPDSAILALSTCFKDQRIVVFFRRIASEPFINA